MSCSVCVKPKSQSPEPNLTGADTIISLAKSHSQALTIHHLKTRILLTVFDLKTSNPVVSNIIIFFQSEETVEVPWRLKV